MKPLRGFIIVKGDGVVTVQLRNGQKHDVQTSEKFIIREKVILLFDYENLEVTDIVRPRLFEQERIIYPVKTQFQDDDEEETPIGCGVFSDQFCEEGSAG